MCDSCATCHSNIYKYRRLHWVITSFNTISSEAHFCRHLRTAWNSYRRRWQRRRRRRQRVLTAPKHMHDRWVLILERWNAMHVLYVPTQLQQLHIMCNYDFTLQTLVYSHIYCRSGYCAHTQTQCTCFMFTLWRLLLQANDQRMSTVLRDKHACGGRWPMKFDIRAWSVNVSVLLISLRVISCWRMCNIKNKEISYSPPSKSSSISCALA